MPPLYANDIGGMGQVLMQDRAFRAQQGQAALARMMQAQQQQQQQRNFEAQMQQSQGVNQFNMRQAMERQAMEAQRGAATDAYNERSYREVILPESKARLESYKDKTAAVDAKEVFKHLENDLTFRVQNRLPYNPGDYSALPDAVKAPLIQFDQEQRRQEVETFNKAKEAATAGRRIRIIKQRAAELAKQPREGMFRPDIGNPRWGATPSQNPPQMSRDMLAQVAQFDQRFAPLLDPKSGLLTVDPNTGDYLPSPNIIKPWMDGGRNLRIQSDGATTGGQAPKVLDAQTAKTLLDKAGGDKATARKLAIEMGFQIPQLQ